ncbi:MAG: DUF4157 domain-containing protein [Chitinophagales bacterium]|nr:DUF4157 domain-containing protein [Chitinophagales bacterium]
MQTYADKSQEKYSHSITTKAKKERSQLTTIQFIDKRSEATQLKKLQRLANESALNQEQLQFSKIANEAAASTQESSIQRKENKTGLPDNLKSGIENLSGYSMNDVRVHYNSNKPAQLNAHAYAQGTNIHIASGQEKHLPHEAWHVVQQKQGRVKPTMQTAGGVNVNDNKGLEREADVMGRQALQGKFIAKRNRGNHIDSFGRETSGVIQRALTLSPNSVAMDANNTAKLADVIRIANAAHGMDAAVTAANIDVIIEITSPGRTDISPAYTLPAVATATGHSITVEIQRAYFELATVGELLGMIAHELGVHGYNDALGNAPLAGPRWNPIPSARPGRAATGYVVGAQGRHVSDDHLDVSQAIVPGIISVKANKYVDSILYHGNAIEADAHLTAAEKLQAQGELISSYCFDIARIVATDDRMAYVPAHWDAIREVYADTYAFLQGVPALAGTPWFAAAPLKLAAQLKPDFNSLGRRFAWNKIKGR